MTLATITMHVLLSCCQAAEALKGGNQAAQSAFANVDWPRHQQADVQKSKKISFTGIPEGAIVDAENKSGNYGRPGDTKMRKMNRTVGKAHCQAAKPKARQLTFGPADGCPTAVSLIGPVGAHIATATAATSAGMAGPAPPRSQPPPPQSQPPPPRSKPASPPPPPRLPEMSVPCATRNDAGPTLTGAHISSMLLYEPISQDTSPAVAVCAMAPQQISQQQTWATGASQARRSHAQDLEPPAAKRPRYTLSTQVKIVDLDCSAPATVPVQGVQRTELTAATADDAAQSLHVVGSSNANSRPGTLGCLGSSKHLGASGAGSMQHDPFHLLHPLRDASTQQHIHRPNTDTGLGNILGKSAVLAKGSEGFSGVAMARPASTAAVKGTGESLQHGLAAKGTGWVTAGCSSEDHVVTQLSAAVAAACGAVALDTSTERIWETTQSSLGEPLQRSSSNSSRRKFGRGLAYTATQASRVVDTAQASTQHNPEPVALPSDPQEHRHQAELTAITAEGPVAVAPADSAKQNQVLDESAMVESACDAQQPAAATAIKTAMPVDNIRDHLVQSGDAVAGASAAPSAAAAAAAYAAEKMPGSSCNAPTTCQDATDSVQVASEQQGDFIAGDHWTVCDTASATNPSMTAAETADDHAAHTTAEVTASNTDGMGTAAVVTAAVFGATAEPPEVTDSVTTVPAATAAKADVQTSQAPLVLCPNNIAALYVKRRELEYMSAAQRLCRQHAGLQDCNLIQGCYVAVHGDTPLAPVVIRRVLGLQTTNGACLGQQPVCSSG